jgi:hypothetical protein
MSDLLNDTPTPRENISLEEVAQLPALFESVVERQMSSNVAAVLLEKVKKELADLRQSLLHFQLLNGVIYANVVEKLQQQEAALTVRQESLETVIETAKQLTIAMGHLATGKALLDSLNATIESPINMESDTKDTFAGSFDVPVVKDLREVTSVEVAIPKRVIVEEELPKPKPVVDFTPRFQPRKLPQGVGRGLLKPVSKSSNR